MIIHAGGTSGINVERDRYGQAAWSFNTLGDYGDATRYLGFCGGLVVLDPLVDGFVGTVRGTNTTPDSSAIIFACLWSMRSGNRGVKLVCDAQYAANMAAAKWSPTANCEFVAVVVGAVALLAQLTSLLCGHVCSHKR